jgi:hypothetical protein
MSRKQSTIETSINLLRVTMLRIRASHESTQQILHDTSIHVGKLQHQLHDLQQQLNTLTTEHMISQTDTGVNVHAYSHDQCD